MESHCVPVPLEDLSTAGRLPPDLKIAAQPATTHLKPLGDALGDADSEFSYLGRTRFPFLAIRFIFSLGFHNNLSQETERRKVSDKLNVLHHMCPEQVAWGCQVQRYPPFLQAVREASTAGTSRYIAYSWSYSSPRKNAELGNREVMLTGQGHRTDGWQTKYPLQQNPGPGSEEDTLLPYWLFCAAHLLNICVTG